MSYFPALFSNSLYGMYVKYDSYKYDSKGKSRPVGAASGPFSVAQAGVTCGRPPRPKMVS